ncbi:MAG: hypothetical protein ACI88A_003022 [Paraglaciecola sp.]
MPQVRVKLFNYNCAIALLTLLLSAVHTLSFAADLVPRHLSFTSPHHTVSLVEVYSSQGCSSCPPAEKWVNQFVTKPKLWEEIIPMVFHVDYWDYIGWSDPYAKAQYSLRQQNYKRAGRVNSVYTPGFVLNGREWRGWFSGKSLPISAKLTGVLSVHIDRDYLSLSYSPDIAEHTTLLDKQDLEMHMTLLGFGLKTEIKRGENAYKTLVQDFVVLEYETLAYSEHQAKSVWPKSSLWADKYALVVWLTKSDDLSPIQATGGHIPSEWLDTQHPLSKLN